MLLTKSLHQKIYYFGLIVVVVGLPLSKVLMSIGQLILSVNWLLEGNLKEKCLAFFKNTPALLISFLFLIHIIGLSYSSNWQQGLNDLRILLPLLALPIIISTSVALSKKWMQAILLLFVSVVTISAGFSLLIHFQIVPIEIENPREISRFISHIRLSLLCSFALFITFFLAKEKSVFILLVFLLVPVYVSYFFVINSMTGIAVTLFAGLFLLIKYLLQKKISQQKLLLSFLGLIACLFIVALFSICKKPVLNSRDISALDKKTSNGNLYRHYANKHHKENGHYTYDYICYEELAIAWNNKKSASNFSEKTANGMSIRATLIRFLTSKGLRKDAEGVSQLSIQEIKAIETGIANVNYLNRHPFVNRFLQIDWEIKNYRNGGNPQGNSVAQRFEFWNTAIASIKSHFWFGTGTGTLEDTMAIFYKKTKSKLHKKYQFKPHNQFLSISVTLGIIGLICFMGILVLPAIISNAFENTLFVLFFIIATLSMFTEDTLFSQDGISFFAFFYCLFNFSMKDEN